MIWFSSIISWIVIEFGLNRQSILKSGFLFGMSITYSLWIWIGLRIQKKWIEQQPAWILPKNVPILQHKILSD